MQLGTGGQATYEWSQARPRMSRSVFIVHRLGGRAVSEIIFKDSDRVVSNKTWGPPPLVHLRQEVDGAQQGARSHEVVRK